MATQAQAPQAVPITMMAGNAGLPDGALFGLPGVTIYSEQKENNSPTATVPSATAQTTALFPANFKQTDIVYAWRMIVNVTFGAAPTGTGIAITPEFPYNFIGPMALNIQNQFDTISVFTGFDMALFQMIRPQKQTSWVANFNDQMNAVAFDAYNDAPNSITSSAYTVASTAINFDLDLLPGIQFDLYYDLEENGMLLSNKAQGIRTFVSPQMMAGTNRIIQPRVQFNQGGGLATAGNDTATYPYSTTAGAVTYTTPNINLIFRRKITYQPQSTKDAPLLWNWQYSRQCVRNTIGAVSSLTIPLPLVGQILAFFIRFQDPGNAQATQNIPLATNVSELDVQIGSGLFRFQDTVEDMQSRFWRQHGIRPPLGVAVWDMATTDDGRISNKDAINTLTTSGCQVVVTFSVVPTASAYYVLGYEALRYVALQ
jgi:hypothetical protein